MPRPSSPLGAKASTERSYRAQSPPSPARRTKTHAPSQGHATSSAHDMTAAAKTGSATFTHTLTNHSDSPVKQHAPGPHPITGRRGQRRIPLCSDPHPAPRRQAGHKTLETVGIEPTTPCLQSRCSPTELRPLNLRRLRQAPAEWAREDLNLRPHAYQACALTN